MGLGKRNKVVFLVTSLSRLWKCTCQPPRDALEKKTNQKDANIHNGHKRLEVSAMIYERRKITSTSAKRQGEKLIFWD